MNLVAVGDTQLYCTESGPSSGRPVLLLHASLQTGESMEPIRKLMEGEPFRILIPDQRGHGRSANPGGALSIPQMALDMAVLMERLGFHRPVVVGYSLGGTVALELAVRGLVSGLVILASRIHPAPRGRRAFLPEDIRNRSPQWAQQLAERHVATPWEQLALTIGEMFETWPGFTPEALRAIACPTLVVQGDKDEMVPVEQAHELAAAVPGARLHVAPRAGHPELLYRPDAMVAVRQFLSVGEEPKENPDRFEPR